MKPVSSGSNEAANNALQVIGRLGDMVDRINRPFRPVLRLTSSMRTFTKMAAAFSRLANRQRR